jgi:hypothetical protein
MLGRNFRALHEIAEDNYGFLTVDDGRRVGIFRSDSRRWPAGVR